MNDNTLQKRPSTALKERGQYMLAFGVIASMLLVVGFPVFVIFFLGIFAYFLWKIFSTGSRNETREIFEFYLAANDILRDDERRWFGFEMKEVVLRGEHILQSMPGAPPLVHFTLGALYNKLGDHRAAVQHLSPLIESDRSDEKTVVFPTPELRNYVRVLRKIERDPAEAPLTSGAVRALERARKNRSKALLDESRMVLETEALKPVPQLQPESNGHKPEPISNGSITEPEPKPKARVINVFDPADDDSRGEYQSGDKKKNSDLPYSDRKPISEVLHDIYDRNFP
jgi:hypothetical protein